MQFVSYNLPHKLVEIEYIPATVSTRLDPWFYVFTYAYPTTKAAKLDCYIMNELAFAYADFVKRILLFYVYTLFMLCVMHYIICYSYLVLLNVEWEYKTFILQKFSDQFFKHLYSSHYCFFNLYNFNIKFCYNLRGGLNCWNS